MSTSHYMQENSVEILPPLNISKKIKNLNYSILKRLTRGDAIIVLHKPSFTLLVAHATSLWSTYNSGNGKVAQEITYMLEDGVSSYVAPVRFNTLLPNGYFEFIDFLDPETDPVS